MSAPFDPDSPALQQDLKTAAQLLSEVLGAYLPETPKKKRELVRAVLKAEDGRILEVMARSVASAVNDGPVAKETLYFLEGCVVLKGDFGADEFEERELHELVVPEPDDALDGSPAAPRFVRKIIFDE